MNELPFIVAAVAGLSLLFIVAWAWARKIDNYSIVDALWAFAIGLTAVFWLATGSGDIPKRIGAAALVVFWSIRLGSHLQHRIRRSHPEEDSRYRKLRKTWQGREAAAFFWFFQGQALSALLLALPFLFIARDVSDWGTFESIGLTVALTGICGEALADHQMTSFKKRHNDAKQVCREGLWRYSRHPNYFFESIIWLGFYLYACGSAGGWVTLFAPLIILSLLLWVTGVPPTEAASLARKGDAYRAYQRTTSVFVPLPPKHDSAS